MNELGHVAAEHRDLAHQVDDMNVYCSCGVMKTDRFPATGAGSY